MSKVSGGNFPLERQEKQFQFISVFHLSGQQIILFEKENRK